MRERFDVRGKTVFITGAARGIGAESARRLHAKGANVALAGLEPDLLERLADELGERAAAFEVDVTDLDALEGAARATAERFGGIDVGIANAGIAFVGTLSGAAVADVERTLAVNLLGVWRTDRALLPYVTERRGYLLNIASLAAVAHGPLMGPYAAAKAGVEALSDSLRIELAPSGTRVGCAYFGFIDTDLVRATAAHPARQIMEGAMPSWMSRAAPLSTAIDAIERGIERRAARVWAPRFVGPLLRLRGFLQPLADRSASRNADLPRALAAADSEATPSGDPVLGIAAQSRGEPVAATTDERTGGA